MKRPPHRSPAIFSFLWFALALLVSATIGIALAQWQPQWFGPILPHQTRSDDAQKFVLATDRLFLPQESKLKTEALSLLDEISLNVDISKGKNVRIVSYIAKQHTQERLNLSYQRALTLEKYLKKRPNAERYYWFSSAIYDPDRGHPTDRIEVIVN